MTWQRPPADPGRSAMWEGGCRRVFGAVSDGVTRTFGLRETAATYLVLFDGVVVPSSVWSVDSGSGAISFEYVPPIRGWIEVLGFGPGATLPGPSVSGILNYDRDAAIAALGSLKPVLNPRFLVSQADRRPAHSVNGGVLAPDGNGWFIPQDEYDMLRVDRGWERVRTPTLDLHGFAKYAGGMLGPDGKVYGCPDTATSVLRYDPLTGTGKHLPITPFRGDHVWSNDMFLSGVGVDGIIYGVPFDAEYVLAVDLSDMSMRALDFGFDFSGRFKYWGCAGVNGRLVFAPWYASKVLIADVSAGTAYETASLLQPELFEPRGNFAGAFADERGRVHLLQACGSRGMVVDPETGFVAIRKTNGRAFGGGEPPRFLGGGQEDNGLVHYNPYSTDEVHWTMDGRDFAIDSFASGASGEREAAGVRDFGDHVWTLHDSGDTYLQLQSGLEWGYWTKNKDDETFHAYVSPSVQVPADTPKFTWGRNYAFFGLLNANKSNYAIPSSQP